MDGRIIRVLACLAALNVARVCAQTEARAPDPPAIDPTKLGVSFDRVRMQLSHPDPSKTSGLRIQETVEVVATAPRLDLWNPKTVNLTSQAVPFGAPTHKDILKLTTPKEFQNYPFDLNALAEWLMQQLSKKSER